MTILDHIHTKGLLLDGAMGTMLMQKGIKSGTIPELMNLEKPDIILDIHRAYLDAGSDMITTNTFGGSRIKLKKAGLENETENINRSAATIARQAVSQDQFIAGDIGPPGDMLQPFGLISSDEARQNFSEQAYFLADAGVDVFIVETMFDVNESLAAIRGIQSVSDLPIFATLTFENTSNGFNTIMGNPVSDSMKILVDAGATAVGANCSIGSDNMVKLAVEIRNCVKTPVIIQPNAGIPEMKESQLHYPESPAYYARNIKAIKDIGVEIVGGCCGTTPEYISAIKRLLNQS
ncbi:MAG: homocysteine S-methyltransferase family protein [Candidatus Marinimicrobia bacterium]|nr:homocysteine S-methyltransferase family protein [Candidatus Neomarinimicrobiota bacterium]